MFIEIEEIQEEDDTKVWSSFFGDFRKKTKKYLQRGEWWHIMEASGRKW